MKPSYTSLLAIFVLVLNACGKKQSPAAQSTSPEPTISATSTPDPCVGENLTNSVKEVNDLTREFDDTYQLARNLPIAQTPPFIADLQRVRREAEDQATPPCLSTLKASQLAYMNTAVNTMIDFVGGKDINTLNQGLTQALQEHEKYTLEIARLLGLTPISATPTSAVTPAP